jgi:glycosyltransferase involved in cell wall biosynthesis
MKMRLAYPFFSGFIANSEAVKKHFVDVDGIIPDKISVIYNGINIEPVPQPYEYEPADGYVVGIVANCNRRVKRVEDFIKAAALLTKKIDDLKFVVVGDGSLRPQLESLCSTLGILNKVSFVGNVPNPIDYILRFNVGVITSETEGFCNAILEYMVCGVPVVATNTGGNPELVNDGENGFLVDVGDVYGMCEKIMCILQDSAKCRIMRNNNMIKVTTMYGIDRFSEAHENYYLGIAKHG